MKRKILFVVPFYLGRSPSQRYRIEWYIQYFEKNGYQCDFSYLLSPRTDKFFYSKRYTFLKFLLIFKFFFIRIKDVFRAKKYNLVFVQREACFLGFSFFEKLLAKRPKLIFDFDDAIWLPNVSDANKKWEWLKNYKKTEKIISYAHHVIAGNQYLANYAKNFTTNISIIPTTIDTDIYKIPKKRSNDKILIGWSGSPTTIQHFRYGEPFLKAIQKKYPNKIEFKLIGDASYYNKELNIQGIAWSKEKEVSELSDLDIGIMPLPDDKWTKGKCGLKGLQYMALEIPTIMSPVGVNTEIIQDSENGFLASSKKEWIEKLSLLIENKELRKKIGIKGRETVEQKYSVQSQKDKYLEIFNQVCS